MIYEINFLVLQSKTAELDKIRKETKKFIESYGAKIVEEKEYLKRKLAYEIKHENYGFFTVLRFETKDGMNFDELKVKLNQKSNIARYIIVRADELPSLDEQEVKKEEKTYTNKKSIKSEDVEKALSEQKKAEAKKEKEPEKEVLEEAEEVEDKKEEVAEEKKPATAKTEESKEESQNQPVQDAEKVKKEKPAKTKADKKETEGKEGETEKKEAEEKVSLDELDKKLDEILNS